MRTFLHIYLRTKVVHNFFCWRYDKYLNISTCNSVNIVFSKDFAKKNSNAKNNKAYKNLKLFIFSTAMSQVGKWTKKKRQLN